ncbi:MAG: hypothetical protein KatS3mg077_0612 [Candidatus Binatia bacterium]|nr:MAG: hypothetical protein KatS3mg077_0612 [Candidatus Binatia bacterium]
MKGEILRQAIREFTSSRHYRDAFVARWISLNDADALALYDLATQLRLGENQLRDLWEWAEDIAQRDRETIAEVLNEPSIRGALQEKQSRNDRLNRVKHLLRCRRYPHLSQTEDRARALVRSARLPQTVEVGLPAYLEGDTIRVICRGSSPAELRAALEAALRWATSDACTELFRLLGGEL